MHLIDFITNLKMIRMLWGIQIITDLLLIEDHRDAIM